MAELELDKTIERTEQLKTGLEGLNSGLKEAAEKMLTLSGAGQAAQEALTALDQGVATLSDSLGIQKETADGVIGLIAGMTMEYAGLTSSLTKMSDASVIGMTSLEKSTESFNFLLNRSEKSLDDLMKKAVGEEAFNSFWGKALQSLGDGAQASIKTLLQYNQEVIGFQNSMLSALSTAGRLGTSTEDREALSANLDDMARQYQDFFQTVSYSTGLLPDEVQGYSKAMYGALISPIEQIELAGSEMTKLEAVVRLSRGTHQDFGTVLGYLKEQEAFFNDGAADAIDNFALLHKAAQDTQTPFTVLNSIVSSVNKTMKDAGDNTESAVRIFETLAPRLKAAGAGYEVMGSMIEKVIQSVSTLDISQKAFLSSQAGGPGGLQGAYQIEKMTKDGQLSEIFDMVQESLLSKFGEITTLDQASQSQEAASSFTEQSQFLMQGPFGQLVGNVQQADKLLQALSGGGGDLSTVDKEAALRQVMDEDLTIQEQQTGIFTNLLTAAQMQLTEAKISSRALTSLAKMSDEQVEGIRNAAKQDYQKPEASIIPMESTGFQRMADVAAPLQGILDSIFSSGERAEGVPVEKTPAMPRPPAAPSLPKQADSLPSEIVISFDAPPEILEALRPKAVVTKTLRDDLASATVGSTP